jgi:GT2 family glycosyltransferase
MNNKVKKPEEQLKKSPYVSIIIVNYNGAPFLPLLFSSLEKQTFKDFEIIFVDNASKDKSIKIAEDFSRKERIRMKIIKLSQNFGFCKGNNIGLSYAEGKYVVLLNNDTFVAPNWLEELVKCIESDEKIGICQSKIINLRDKKNVLGNFKGVYGIKRRFLNKYFKNLFYASGTSLIILKDLISKLGFLFDEKQFTGDEDLSWRVRLLGYKIVTNVKSICFHYQGYSSTLVMRNYTKIFSYVYSDDIRTFIKNYSLPFIFKRSLIFFLIKFIESIYYTLALRQPIIYSFFKGIIWNVLNFSDTWREHLTVQKLRRVSDDEIEEYMLPYPAELYFWRLKISKWRNRI